MSGEVAKVVYRTENTIVKFGQKVETLLFTGRAGSEFVIRWEGRTARMMRRA
jgi:hypothetical protein